MTGGSGMAGVAGCECEFECGTTGSEVKGEGETLGGWR